MNYRINWESGDGVFAVPDAVADKGLKLASGKALKVILYLLKEKHLPDDPSQIGVTAEDMEDALSFWEQLGIIVKSDPETAPPEKNVPAAQKETVRVIAPPPAPKVNPVADKASKALLPREISERIEQSEEIAFLFKSAEESLKRVLTFDDQRTILWFYDHLGMSVDIITMLIAFCCTTGRTSMAKIERTAEAWAEKNISTHEQAENEILLMQKAFSFEGRVSSRLGLQSKLTASQKKYIDDWALKDISADLVELAYDKTVDSIGKPSFNYMNKILLKWYENGICDVNAAVSFDERTRPVRGSQNRSPVKNSSPAPSAPSYDLDALLSHAMSSTPVVRKKEAM